MRREAREAEVAELIASNARRIAALEALLEGAPSAPRKRPTRSA
jgi:hypothetical protein